MADTTLAAVMILLSFETYTATQQNLTGWFSHAKGASQLVKMRGNKNASSGIAQQLYLGSRMWQLICGIGQRKAITNAAAPPPQTYTGLFASYSMLFDILFTMLAIMEQADIVNAMLENMETQNADSAISILSYMFQNFESNLDGWYDQLLQNESDGDEQKLFWLEHSYLSDQLPLESPQRVYSTYMHFQNLDIGEQLILYWGFSLLTHLLIYKTELNIRSRTSLTISLYSTDASRQASLTKQHLCADRITQSLEYFLNYGVSAVAVSFLGVPMNVAFGYWAQYDLPQRRWFELIFERLRSTHRGYGSLMAEMAQKGGGGEGFRAAIGKTPKAELNTERLRSNLQRSQYTC
ncbi:hypothetical protein LTS08_001591 [Lithohypha guttulata]|nr:hypothetical protein LTS08_001591 [Lithohypha guttulata]